MVKSEVVNVIATASLNQKLDLDTIGLLGYVFHDEAVYGGHAAYFRSPEMKGTVSLFSSGKMISVGTSSELDAVRGLECARDYLVSCGIVRSVDLDPKIHNIVAVVDLEEPINLEILAIEHSVVYEPEQFPGAILRIKTPFKASILFFNSGRIVITGVKSTRQVDATLDEILKIMPNHVIREKQR